MRLLHGVLVVDVAGLLLRVDRGRLIIAGRRLGVGLLPDAAAGLSGHLHHDSAVGCIRLEHPEVDLVPRPVVILERLVVPHSTVRDGDERLHVVAQIDHDPLLLNPHNAALALHARCKTLREPGPGIVEDLLDSEGDALVLAVHIENHHFHFLALADDLRRMLHALGPAHVGHVHQPVDPRLDLHEGAEGSQVAHLPLQPRPRRILEREGQPGILLDLLHAQRDLLGPRIHLQHHGLDLVRDGHQLRWMADVARPRHLRNVDQPLDTLLQLDEGPVVGDRDHLPVHAHADRVLEVDVGPRIGKQLLEPERDPLSLPVDVEHLDVQLLANAHHVGGVSHPPPRHVRDVQQPVQSAQIDESAEIGDVLDDARPHLAHQQFLDQGLALLAALGLQDHAPRHHDVATPLIQLDDLEVVDVADQVLDVGHPAQGDLRAREEGVHAHEIHGHAALDLANQRALDRRPALVRFADLFPDPKEVGLLLRQDHHPVVVLEALEQDLHLVAGREGLGVPEFLARDRSLALEAEFEDDGGVCYPHHLGLNDLALAHLLNSGLEVLEHGAEVVARHGRIVVVPGVVRRCKAAVASWIGEEFVRSVERREVSEGLAEGRINSGGIVGISTFRRIRSLSTAGREGGGGHGFRRRGVSAFCLVGHWLVVPGAPVGEAPFLAGPAWRGPGSGFTKCRTRKGESGLGGLPVRRRPGSGTAFLQQIRANDYFSAEKGMSAPSMRQSWPGIGVRSK